MIEEQLEKHKIAAKKLGLIKDRVFSFIKRNINKVSEYEVNKFLLSEFKKQKMIIQKEYPIEIIAFGQNTSFVHYFPKAGSSKIIGRNNLVLIDIWAKLNEKDAPFADITWMGYTGKKVPEEIRKAFKTVIGAREEVIRFIKKNLKNKRLPQSVEIEKAARSFLDKSDVEEFFTHGVGHSLGIIQDHGIYFRFSRKSKTKLKINIPFTIEPGLYYKNEFGARSEIDCYIDKDYKFVVTTAVQKQIIKI